jgi:pyruvate,orthophosphate dikinase
MTANISANLFIRDVTAQDVEDANRYGGKASGLARMAAIGIPIPPAFVIGTAGFQHFRAHGGLSEELQAQVRGALRGLEIATGKAFGGDTNPLLVSVRSGAAISMPGMMDTVLNLGLTPHSALHLAGRAGGLDFALDSWLRFWRMFSEIVLGLDPAALLAAVDDAVRDARDAPTRASFAALQAAILGHIAANGEAASDDPFAQLMDAIAAVFRSWDSRRAKAYRQHHGIADDLGTAVTVQAMVFGNADENSGSGVAFTRNPNDGEKALYGEYLIGRQGEDLVAGTHTPIDLADPAGMDGALRDALIAHGGALEKLYQDAVDIEFTVESGQLYLLQVRAAKRTAAAAVRIAEALVAEGVITPAIALRRISVEQVRKLSRPAFEEAALAAAAVLAQGLGSSPGHAHGAAILDSDRAAEHAARGEAVILLRPTTSPQDIRGMIAAAGIVTAKGGALSHAAVVSRALDKPCIVGCETIEIDLAARCFTIDGRRFAEGDLVSVDGASGKVFEGSIALRAGGGQGASLRHVLGWADTVSGAAIWTASRSAEEILHAREHGVSGFGPVGLTDLIIGVDAIDELVRLTAEAGAAKPPPRVFEALSTLVERASRPAILAAQGLPLHIRLPRAGSERARRLIKNWVELPPNLFLPMGTLPYVRAILEGLSAAARAVHHREVVAVVAGITEPPEFEAFRKETSRIGVVGAGAKIQNLAALHMTRGLAAGGVPLWLDIGEIIRTAYGFPSEVQQAAAALDGYAAGGMIAANPYRHPAGFVMEPIAAALSGGDDAGRRMLGVDAAGDCPSELLAALYRFGVRHYAAAAARRDEIRLLLGQCEGG